MLLVVGSWSTAGYPEAARPHAASVTAQMWHARTVSVVLMTYAEKDSIRGTIEGFLATGVVDEVVVVDNNAEPGTHAEVAATAAREVHEPRQGYGFATQRGLAEATGDLIVLCEPDGTFMPDDIFKLLVYSDDCDVVFGTRTTRELLWQGANMGFLLKWGNWGLAKVIEVLFNTSHLSDVGCTYRLLRREALERVQHRFSRRLGALRARADAALHHVRAADGGGAGELPPPGRGLVGDGQHGQGRPPGRAHGRPHPRLPAAHPGPQAAGGLEERRRAGPAGDAGSRRVGRRLRRPGPARATDGCSRRARRVDRTASG